ncbi:MAG TPA: cyclase family protein [Actinomycetota bacterium]
MTRVIDVSLTVGGNLLVWPGDPAVEVVRRASLAAGDHANVSELRLGTHTGTHIDAPVHFIEDAAGIDAVPVEALVGPAVVADLRGWSEPIGPEELDRLGVPDGTERLLLRTANSELWRSLPIAFPDEYAHLTPEGAGWVVERGINLVGVDFLSIERKGAEGHPVHVALLSNDVVIVEGLDLGDVEPGPYTLAALPLRVAGGDGAPARVVLIEG